MNCKEFQELVAAGADECLPEQELEGFRAHARQCPLCARAFELERLTKELVRSRVKRVKAPGKIAAGILDHLTDRPLTLAPPIPRRILSRRNKLSIAGAATVLAGIAVFVAMQSVRPTDFVGVDEGRPLDDLIAQSRENYRAVLAGGIEAEAMSREAQALYQFFEGKTEFSVFLPAVENTISVGGALSHAAGRGLAHLIYSHRDGPIYVYEACWKRMQAEGATRRLPSSMVDELKRRGRCVGSVADGLTSVAWTHGSTLCIAVSTLPGEKLLAMLTSDAEPISVR